MVGWLGQDCSQALAPLLATSPTPLLVVLPLVMLLGLLLVVLPVPPLQLLLLSPAPQHVQAQPPPLPAHPLRLLVACCCAGPCGVTSAAALAWLQVTPQAAAGVQTVTVSPTCST